MHWDGARVGPVCIGVHWNGTGMTCGVHCGMALCWTVVECTRMALGCIGMHWECARMHWGGAGMCWDGTKMHWVHWNGTGMALA